MYGVADSAPHERPCIWRMVGYRAVWVRTWVVELLLDDSGLSGAGEATGVARERYTPLGGAAG